MYQCRACGGNLRFDIKSQKLYCEYCGSFFDPGEYDEGSGAEESNVFGVTVFTCQQCGAELISTDNSATGFCSYCGASTVLSSRLGTEKRPKLITPFLKTKEDCMKAYSDVISRAWYAPKELRNPEFLERFRGIYMPYWLYRIHFNNSITLPAVSEKRDGNYTIRDEMNVTCDLGGNYGSIPYDASSSFDDQIAQTIAPFSAKKMLPFKPAYLAGFYADTSDVEPEVYRQDAMDRAGEYAIDVIRSKMASGGVRPEMPGSKAEVEEALGTKCEYPEGAFLPVWFLTWRKKERVAYAIVNGETGKVSADIPVDLGRYFLGTILVAAVLFVIGTLLVSMTAPTALSIASVLAAVAGGLFCFELRSIMRKENHIEDKGFFSRGGGKRSRSLAEDDEKRQREKGKNKKSSGKGMPAFAFYFLMLLGWMFLDGFFGALLESFSAVAAGIARVLPYCALIAGGVFFGKSMVLVRDVEEKSLFIPALTSFLAVVCAALINYMNPFEDLIYYAACIGCLTGVTVTCVELIRRHNLIATRPVPSFFNREGGNDKREKGGGTTYSGPGGASRADRVMGWILIAVLGGSVLLGAAQTVSAAERRGRNDQTGYEMIILDEADLLTDEEEDSLLWDMEPVTNYGGAAFVTGYYYDTQEQAKELYRSWFGTDSGTLFMIDMGSRIIYIFSDGAVYGVITKAYANTITDNVYRYATRGEYYRCASEAFSQITSLLKGGHIARPMKHITNALIALILSLLINYAMVRWTAKIAKPTKAAILGAMTVGFAASGRRTKVLRTTRRYTGSSGSGGGGGGFSGGGGGGFSGGGSSGGGGGHGF
ncbi:MAG: TPM domain-containing protein [Lachnospiraceae bacterium]|nr:TPM domain-containing protein [Lachnospiraceae bacterium]